MRATNPLLWLVGVTNYNTRSRGNMVGNTCSLFFKKRKRLKVVDGATKPSMTHSNIFCPFYKSGNHSLWTPNFFFLLLLSRFSFGRRNLENYVHSKFHERVLFLEFLRWFVSKIMNLTLPCIQTSCKAPIRSLLLKWEQLFTNWKCDWVGIETGLQLIEQCFFG